MNYWEHQNCKKKKKYIYIYIYDKRVSYYTACEHSAGRNTKKPDPVKVKMFQTGYKGIFRTLSNT